MIQSYVRIRHVQSGPLSLSLFPLGIIGVSGSGALALPGWNRGGLSIGAIWFFGGMLT